MAAGGSAGKCHGGKIPAEASSKPLEDMRSRYTQLPRENSWGKKDVRLQSWGLTESSWHWWILTSAGLYYQPPPRRPQTVNVRSSQSVKCLLMKLRLINKEAHWAFISDSSTSIIISIGYIDRQDGWGVTRYLLILNQISFAHHGQPSGCGWIQTAISSAVRLISRSWSDCIHMSWKSVRLPHRRSERAKYTVFFLTR